MRFHRSIIFITSNGLLSWDAHLPILPSSLQKPTNIMILLILFRPSESLLGSRLGSSEVRVPFAASLVTLFKLPPQVGIPQRVTLRWCNRKAPHGILSEVVPYEALDRYTLLQ